MQQPVRALLQHQVAERQQQRLRSEAASTALATTLRFQESGPIGAKMIEGEENEMEEGKDAVEAVRDFIRGTEQSAAVDASVSSAMPPHAHTSQAHSTRPSVK